MQRSDLGTAPGERCYAPGAHRTMSDAARAFMRSQPQGPGAQRLGRLSRSWPGDARLARDLSCLAALVMRQRQE
jgi:hypothetical protein